MKRNQIRAQLAVILLALVVAACSQPASQVADTPTLGTQPTVTATTVGNIGGSQPTAPPALPASTTTPTMTTGRDTPLLATVRNGGNVRSAPSTEGTVVLDQINAGETVLLRMHTPNGQWFSIVDPRGVIGWSWVELLDVEPAVAARVPAGTQDSGVAVVLTPPPARDLGAHHDQPELVSWEGLQLPLPPGYRYEIDYPVNVFEYGVPIQADLTLIPGDVPERSAWRTVAYDGSLDDFLSIVRDTATEEPWLDEASIRRVTVAGLPAIVYNRYRAPRYQSYIVSLRPGLLLLINIDATRAEQTAAVDQLTVADQPPTVHPRAQQIAYIDARDGAVWLFNVATGASEQMAAGPVSDLASRPASNTAISIPYASTTAPRTNSPAGRTTRVTPRSRHRESCTTFGTIHTPRARASRLCSARRRIPRRSSTRIRSSAVRHTTCVPIRAIASPWS
jgi:hypothetical protein